MGYSLVGNAKSDGHEMHFRFNISAWPLVLLTAFRNGWVPRGTSDPIVVHAQNPTHDPRDWNPMDYTSNEGQSVSPRDADLLASATEKALVAADEKLLLEDPQGLLSFVEFCRQTDGFDIC